MNQKFLASWAEKIAVAFGTAFVGAVTVAPITNVSIPTLKALLAAGVAAGAAAVAGLFSKPLGDNKNSANVK